MLVRVKSVEGMIVELLHGSCGTLHLFLLAVTFSKTHFNDGICREVHSWETLYLVSGTWYLMSSFAVFILWLQSTSPSKTHIFPLAYCSGTVINWISYGTLITS